ncbi:MAG: hydrogenase maturation nickel metallochaperone HypA, partial [Raoultibacter sp.]
TYMARGTVAENAELVITRIPFTVRCNACGQVFHLKLRDSDTWHCVACGKKDYQLNSGMEFTIDNIEIVNANELKAQA